MKFFQFVTTFLLLCFSLNANGNTSWDRVFESEGQDNQILAFHVLDENNAWFIGATSNSGNTQINGYRTSSGGNFSQFMLPTSSGMVIFTSITFIDSNNGYLSGMSVDLPFKDGFDLETNIIWKTTNGGMSWEVLDDTLEEMIEKLQSFPSGEVFATSASSFYRLNGSVFEKISLPSFTGDVAALNMVTPMIGFIGGGLGYDENNTSQTPGNGFVMRTSDGGASFTLVKTGLPFKVTAASFVSDSHGWIGGYNGSSGFIYQTTDGGSTFDAQSLPRHPSLEIEFDMPFKFTQTIEESDVTDVAGIKFFDCTRGVALGLSCLSNCNPNETEENPTFLTVFMRTYDGGSTWTMDEHYEESMNNWGQMMPGAKITSGLHQLAFANPNTGYIAGQHLMVLKYTADSPETIPGAFPMNCDGGTNNNNNNNNNGTNDPGFNESNDDGCSCRSPSKSGHYPVSIVIIIGLGFILFRRRFQK
ncbi:hypothetical protein KKF34_14815 [Myxococcota bacterium]|nr:hypothetical protein [Myxococcota bacterium]MBU1382269.1 hypothetical protein [Myxococcota bacterium]MBU1498147.1 hypothetical protein [Myxococcota bacterium]